MRIIRGTPLERAIGAAIRDDLEESNYVDLDYVETKSELRKWILEQLSAGANDAVDDAVYQYVRKNIDVTELLKAIDFDVLFTKIYKLHRENDEEDEEDEGEDEEAWDDEDDEEEEEEEEVEP